MATEVIIQGGCVKLEGVPDTWRYVVSDSEGTHIYVFLADRKPEIGDTIRDGVLIPKTGLIINPDTRIWQTKLKYKQFWGL